MRTCYGITVDGSGGFIYTRLCFRHNGWNITGKKRWNCHSVLSNYLLMHRPVSFCLPAHWVRTIPGEQENTLSARNGIDTASVCMNEIETEHFSDLLQGNIVSVFPDDAFLVSLPLHFSPSAESSFIALSNDDDIGKIGIIVDRKLVSVFNFPAATPRHTKSSIERISRYWRMEYPALPFPEQYYILSGFEPDDLGYEHMEKLSCGTDDLLEMKAAGAALAGITASVPMVRGPSPGSRNRHLRSALFWSTAALLFLVCLSTLALFFVNNTLSGKVAEAKTSYQNIIDNNAEIRELIQSGNRLSQKVLRRHRLASRPSSWGMFLHYLGSVRPDGLFIERLGSDPLPEESGTIRIALAGWAENETTTTEFIKLLNKSPLLSNVTLSSMERVKNNASIYEFKILCILHLLKS